MMLLLHVDASLNTGGLFDSQGGFFCGVTEKPVLKGCDALWSPMAWRSHKMSRTVPSSLDTRAPLVNRSVPALADDRLPSVELSGCCDAIGPGATEQEDENSGRGGGCTRVHSVTTRRTSRQFRDRSGQREEFNVRDILIWLLGSLLVDCCVVRFHAHGSSLSF